MRRSQLVISRTSWLLADTWASVAGAADQADLSRLCSERIVEENGTPGATDWLTTCIRVDEDGSRSPWIEGYCSRRSVLAGDTLDIMVSTDPFQPFHIEIFRTGYSCGHPSLLELPSTPPSASSGIMRTRKVKEPV